VINLPGAIAKNYDVKQSANFGRQLNLFIAHLVFFIIGFQLVFVVYRLWWVEVR
jgi:hypothetical protein